MAVTVNSLKLAKKEFAGTSPDLVAQAIKDATERIDAAAYGAAYDQAITLMAAHLLWASPFGSSMRLEGGGDASKSRYLEELERLRLERVPRYMVLR